MARQSNDELVAEILLAADRREAMHPAIQAGLVSNQIAVQKQAILALGRIGDPTTIKSLAAFLYSPQPEVRQLTAYALGITESNQAVPPLVNRLKTEDKVAVISEILPAIGRLGPNDKGPDIIGVVLGFLDHKDKQVVTASCDALSYAWQIHRATISVPNSTQVYKLLQLAAEDSTVADHCLYSLTRIRTESALFDAERMRQTLETLTSDYQHQLMTTILGAQNRPEFTDYYESHFNATASADLMAVSAQALAALPASLASDKLIQRIIAAKSSFLEHDYIRIGLLNGLGQQAPDDRKINLLQTLASDASEWVRSRAITMLYATDQARYMPDMLALLKSDLVTTQSMILNVANALEGNAREQILTQAKNSQFESIQTQANDLLNKNENDAETPVSESLPYNDIKAFINQRMLIKTNKGDVVIQLLPSAAYTSYNFYKLATQQYYNGTEFHRVIPSFVVQGGDFNGTSDERPGYSIREELYPISHLQGTLGMASSGKDTAGAGFYFNLKDNFHLDRRYTVFARVVSGMQVIQKLGVGDKILEVTTYPLVATK